MASIPSPRRGGSRGAFVLLAASLALAAGCQRSPAPAALAPDTAGTYNSGYGMEERSTSTATVASATASDFGKVRARQVEELMVGRFAGVQVVQTPSGGFTVRIRGVSTFVGNTEPLYVVDGVPVQVAPGRGIDWLNTGDIARIDVLKDAASTAAYGMRGGNGVVLITTKRGR
jgi:TonB-dependent SusC/RagA subfamily outer membrane receptor